MVLCCGEKVNKHRMIVRTRQSRCCCCKSARRGGTKRNLSALHYRLTIVSRKESGPTREYLCPKPGALPNCSLWYWYGTYFFDVCRNTVTKVHNIFERTEPSSSTTTTTTTPATNDKAHQNNHAATMPKNATTKQASNGRSKEGPYQVQGGSKGSGSSTFQEKGGKPAATSNVSRSTSVVGQNDSRPSSSGGSKQQKGYSSARSGDQNFATMNSSTMHVGKSATSVSSTNTSRFTYPRSRTPFHNISAIACDTSPDTACSYAQHACTTTL
jgi:hypothetical protein